MAGAKGVIVACAAGGTSRGTRNFPTGKSSRSLIVSALLVQAGLVAPSNVVHLAGGLNAYFKEGLPGEGEGEWEDRSGRTAPPPGWEEPAE